jgi:tetratricopeptide (TPR) repeat protein
VHSALGFVKGAKEWDYAGSEVSMRRAIALNPNLAAAHINFAQHLSIFSTPDSAIAEWKRGIELDPLSPLYSAWYAGALWEFGRPDEAISQAKHAMELQPDFPVALFVLGLAYADKRDFVEAIAAHQKAVTLYPGQGFTWALARTYALAGQQTKARALLAKLKTATPGDAAHPWFIAAAYAALGDTNEALNWLERGYDSRILFLSNLKRDRAAGFDLRSLHGNARYRDLLRRVNLS